MKRSNIDALIRKQENISSVTRETIEQLQLVKLNRLLAREKQRDGFYRELPEHLDTLDELCSLPFTTAADLAEEGGRMLICSQGEVQKVISEKTSGTTGAGKRVFYTKNDCEHTIELFMAGLGEFIFPGSVTMIAMPFTGPFGLGELIAEAVQRLGARPLKAGTDRTYAELQGILKKDMPDTYVGMPAALLSMLRMCGKGSLKRALISGDACPASITAAIEEILDNRLWPHYGSREMGLGGAICCSAHEGMHLRENHVIAEIVDEKGHVLEEGTWGELVITTIGMEAQPLIRYRTGDHTRILSGPCPCGSIVKRLDSVRRMNQKESLYMLDEVLFRIPEVVDFIAEDSEGGWEVSVLLAGETDLLQMKEQLMDFPIVKLTTRTAQLSDRSMYMSKRKIVNSRTCL
ncbi:MAG: AMP-binding protein [Lachnospiraceae bacterium]|nr:AMP-binding protein [Lachnospiraceae bacterium]